MTDTTEAPASSDGEPTIEEILASIRRIISDDPVPEEGGEEAPVMEEPAYQPPQDQQEDGGILHSVPAEPDDEPYVEPEEDIMDLTEMLEDEDAAEDDFDKLLSSIEEETLEPSTHDELPESFAMQPASIPPAPMPVQHTPPTPRPMRTAIQEPVVAAPAARDHFYDADLISQTTAHATADIMTQIGRGFDHTNKPYDPSDIGTLPVGIRTLETIVKELLRPMLKDWLDTNLPIITEKLVRREIRRLSRQAEEHFDG